jgi:hypothetical protein
MLLILWVFVRPLATIIAYISLVGLAVSAAIASVDARAKDVARVWKYALYVSGSLVLLNLAFRLMGTAGAAAAFRAVFIDPLTMKSPQ